MNIAITADVHLTQDDRHPERLEALENMLGRMRERDIRTLMIAGDLFDESCSGFAGFESLCRENPDIRFIIIPGNHDPDISERIIVGDNISIIQTTSVVELDGLSLVLVPYSGSYGMGEELEGLDPKGRWVLVGHGDYLGGQKERNPYERGIYMPLYRRDIERYQPWKVFLGHIHAPVTAGPVHYPGSPCGIDISETGRRHFLVFDTSTGRVEREMVETSVLYFSEKFLVIPDDDQTERLRNQAMARIAAWGLRREEKSKARVRVTVSGYSSDRDAVMECMKETFSDYVLHDGGEPDISGLSVARDPRRSAIASRAIELIDELEWNFGGGEPEREQVIEKALNVIFQGTGS